MHVIIHILFFCILPPKFLCPLFFLHRFIVLLFCSPSSSFISLLSFICSFYFFLSLLHPSPLSLSPFSYLSPSLYHSFPYPISFLSPISFSNLVEYAKQQDPYLLLTGLYPHSGPCLIALSPDAYSVAIAQGTEIWLYSADAKQEEEHFQDVHSRESIISVIHCIVSIYLFTVKKSHLVKTDCFSASSCTL